MEDEYTILLNEDDYKSLSRIDSALVQSMLGEFKVEKGVYAVEVSKLQFCIIMILAKEKDPTSALYARFQTLGRLQDSGFDDCLRYHKKLLDQACMVTT